MLTVLIETPEHLALRRTRPCPAFDREVAVDRPGFFLDTADFVKASRPRIAQIGRPLAAAVP